MLTDTIQPAEILAAAPDFLAVQMGFAPHCPHPLAQSLTLREIAYALGQKARTKQAFEGDAPVVARGLASSDFSQLLADSVRRVSIAAYDAGSSEYLKFCAVTEVRDFRAEQVAAIDSDLALKMLNELAEIERGQPFTATSGNVVQLSTFARICTLSRTLILNDAFATIRGIFSSVGAHVAQLEAAMLAQALSGNPELDDGQPVFSPANSLEVGLDALTLGEAMAMLRNQKNAAGNPLNLRARHIVCAPEIEYSAKQLVVDAGLDIEVTALAGLPPSRWFLLPGKDTRPVLTVVRLAGSKTPLRVEQKALFKTDGVSIRVRADLGVNFLRRTGIVRGGI